MFCLFLKTNFATNIGRNNILGELKLQNIYAKADANKKIVDLQDKLGKQLKINEGLVLENRQLKVQVAQLSKKVSELESVVNKQSEIIDKLMRKLGLNSDNSSVPPSKNGLNKKPRSGNSREKSGKRSGGQVGHKGTALEFSAHADEEIEHKPLWCYFEWWLRAHRNSSSTRCVDLKENK